MRQLPNLLTLSRLAAAPVIAWLLLRFQFREALGLVLFAGLTDWFDGWTARRLGTSGRLGIILDPLADKTLLVVLFLTLGALGLIPLWMLLLAIGRDVVILVGALLLRLLRGFHQFLPSALGKVSTFFQIVLILLALSQAAFPHRVLVWLGNIGLVLSALFTALSGLDYVRRGIRMARAPAVSRA